MTEPNIHDQISTTIEAHKDDSPGALAGRVLTAIRQTHVLVPKGYVKTILSSVRRAYQHQVRAVRSLHRKHGAAAILDKPERRRDTLREIFVALGGNAEELDRPVERNGE